MSRDGGQITHIEEFQHQSTQGKTNEQRWRWKCVCRGILYPYPAKALSWRVQMWGEGRGERRSKKRYKRRYINRQEEKRIKINAMEKLKGEATREKNVGEEGIQGRVNPTDRKENM